MTDHFDYDKWLSDSFTSEKEANDYILTKIQKPEHNPHWTSYTVFEVSKPSKITYIE